MPIINEMNAKVWSKLGSRGTFAVAMNELGDSLDNLILLTSDLGVLTGLTRFKKTYPEKYINTGIAEQNLLGIASGLAKEGHIVFATTYATFITMRSYEQARLNVAYMNQNVKMVGSGGGLVMGMSGNSHYGIEDIALMRAMPGMTVLSPADGAEIVKCVNAAAFYDGPVYIRLTGGLNNPIVYSDDYDFQVGKAVVLREGTDLTLFATGSMVYQSLVAAEILEKQSIHATVINIHTVKPLDTSAVRQACDSSKLIVTVEEHSILGGLGSAIAEYKSSLAQSPRQVFIGLPDSFLKVGDYQYLLHKYELSGEQIAQRVANEFRTTALLD